MCVAVAGPCREAVTQNERVPTASISVEGLTSRSSGGLVAGIVEVNVQIDNVSGDHFLGLSSRLLASIIPYPIITQMVRMRTNVTRMPAIGTELSLGSDSPWVGGPGSGGMLTEMELEQETSEPCTT